MLVHNMWVSLPQYPHSELSYDSYLNMHHILQETMLSVVNTLDGFGQSNQHMSLQRASL